MLNKYYKDLNLEKREFAIHRISLRVDSSASIIKKVLEKNNPSMDIRKNRVVIHRYSYHRLIKDIQKENSRGL